MIGKILGGIGGAYGAYASTPEGEKPDIMSILGGGLAGVMNPAQGIGQGVISGVGELTDDNQPNQEAPTPIGTMPTNIAKAAVPNDVQNDVTLNSSQPTIDANAQEKWKSMTGQSTDDQAKTMLGIA